MEEIDEFLDLVDKDTREAAQKIIASLKNDRQQAQKARLEARMATTQVCASGMRLMTTFIFRSLKKYTSSRFSDGRTSPSPSSASTIFSRWISPSSSGTSEWRRASCAARRTISITRRRLIRASRRTSSSTKSTCLWLKRSCESKSPTFKT